MGAVSKQEVRGRRSEIGRKPEANTSEQKGSEEGRSAKRNIRSKKQRVVRKGKRNIENRHFPRDGGGEGNIYKNSPADEQIEEAEACDHDAFERKKS